jgi:hypothetical protein
MKTKHPANPPILRWSAIPEEPIGEIIDLSIVDGRLKFKIKFYKKTRRQRDFFELMKKYIRSPDAPPHDPRMARRKV